MHPREVEAVGIIDAEDTYLPPRSRLFNLSPKDLGTERVEGMVSYVVRLARAHCVNPRRLVEIELANANPAIAKFATAFFRRDGGTVNGLGHYAQLFASVLADLTGRQDLRYFTLLPWKEIFPRNGQGLLARYPKWCSVCISKHHGSDHGMAFPLAWSFELYSVCATHQVEMERICGTCGKAQPFFPRYPDLTNCDHCRRPLADGHVRENHSPYSLWVARAIGDMVRRQSETGFTPTIRQFQDSVSAQVTAVTGGNRAAFCRALGFNAHGLRGWLDRGERPSFSQFLAFCYGVGILPGEIFEQDPPKATTSQPRKAFEMRKKRRACPRPAPQRRMELEEALKTELSTDDCRPVSSIAAKYNISPRCLRYWFPELSKTLSDRYKQAVKNNVAAKQVMQCARIQETVRKIEEEGGYPSRRRVYGLLHREGIWLSRSYVSEAYRRATGSRFKKDAIKA